MSLQKCSLSWHAFTTCASHAMSTEKQEVMGLLLGRWVSGRGEGGDNASQSVTVDHAMILSRTDKREDRVEVGYEQLAKASSIAERMSADLGQDTRVVGWYHSHPHITVLPSHVDVRTQGQYQSMDKRFIGLIFSVFSDDKSSKVGTIEVTAFQARNTSEMADAGGSNEAGLGRSAPRGPEEWQRKEVSLSLHMPGAKASTTPLSDALEGVVRLQETLFGEERHAYMDALKQNEAAIPRRVEDMDVDGENATDSRLPRHGADVLSKLFCSAIYSKSLAALTGDSAAPLAQTLQSHLQNLRNRVIALEKRGDELRYKLTAEELAKASTLAEGKVRQPCSAGTGAFQMHEGEQEIPRADALRFARQGGILRRFKVISNSSMPVWFRVFREYSADYSSSKARRTLGYSQASGDIAGGRWIVQGGNSRWALKEIRADSKRDHGIIFVTEEDGEVEATCETQEAFRMWMGVAAAVCPAWE